MKAPEDPFEDGRDFTKRRCWKDLEPHEPHAWCDDDAGTDHWCNGKGRK